MSLTQTCRQKYQPCIPTRCWQFWIYPVPVPAVLPVRVYSEALVRNVYLVRRVRRMEYPNKNTIHGWTRVAVCTPINIVVALWSNRNLSCQSGNMTDHDGRTYVTALAIDQTRNPQTCHDVISYGTNARKNGYGQLHVKNNNRSGTLYRSSSSSSSSSLSSLDDLVVSKYPINNLPIKLKKEQFKVTHVKEREREREKSCCETWFEKNNQKKVSRITHQGTQTGDIYIYIYFKKSNVTQQQQQHRRTHRH